jgi:hypothetical protein
MQKDLEEYFTLPCIDVQYFYFNKNDLNTKFATISYVQFKGKYAFDKSHNGINLIISWSQKLKFYFILSTAEILE